MTSIHLITTGGTIDKIYNPISGNLDIGPPIILTVLEKTGFPSTQFTLTPFLAKDSLDMTEDERLSLAKQVNECKEERILITHGTDTMGASAELIEKTVKGKTVVLTGAMVPYHIDETEAAFNIGLALHAAQNLPHGVYIAMHGQVIPHARFIKDRTQGKFIEAS